MVSKKRFNPLGGHLIDPSSTSITIYIFFLHDAEDLTQALLFLVAYQSASVQ